MSSLTRRFAMNTRPKSQVKRLEMGNYLLDHSYTPVHHGKPWMTQDMVFFYIAFAQEKMGIKIYEQTMIEWNFEDILTISQASISDEEEDSELHWIAIQLMNPPMWTSKKTPGVRAAGSWNKNTVRSWFPPTEQMKDHFTDIRTVEGYGIDPRRKADQYVMQIAFHTVKETWTKYFHFPIQAGKMKNYDRALNDQLLLQGPPMVIPFPDEDWCKMEQYCDNCDDEDTKSKVYCIECQKYFCKECDIVWHKSREMCAHSRRLVTKVQETIFNNRAKVGPCHCNRLEQFMPCVCAQNQVYCRLDCKCQVVNLFNYKAGGEEDEADTAFFSYQSVPVRLRKTKRRKTTKQDDAADFLEQDDPAVRGRRQQHDDFMD